MQNRMTIDIHHVSLLVNDTAKSVAFYNNVIGLTFILDRPDLDYPGAWFELGNKQLHLIELPNPDKDSVRPKHGGRDHHIALSTNNIAALEKELEKEGIPFTRSKSGRKAIFFRDPDDNALEFIEVS